MKKLEFGFMCLPIKDKDDAGSIDLDVHVFQWKMDEFSCNLVARGH